MSHGRKTSTASSRHDMMAASAISLFDKKSDGFDFHIKTAVWLLAKTAAKYSLSPYAFLLPHGR
jgi:hypothetical protein